MDHFFSEEGMTPDIKSGKKFITLDRSIMSYSYTTRNSAEMLHLKTICGRNNKSFNLNANSLLLVPVVPLVPVVVNRIT